jgi:hypothetical protein
MQPAINHRSPNDGDIVGLSRPADQYPADAETTSDPRSACSSSNYKVESTGVARSRRQQGTTRVGLRWRYTVTAPY